MTNLEKLQLLRTAKRDTIVGTSVRYQLDLLYGVDHKSPEMTAALDRIIANIHKSWKDSPALVESCFFNIKDLF